MYNEKLAVAIKSAGKVLREFKDTVYVPFGAEYSIFIKNLNSVRVIAKVSIDGVPVDDNDEGFVVNANSSLDLERFLKNGNMNKGNRFKFIERTSKVEQHRGIEVEDGLIRVEFQFEKPAPKVEEIHHYRRHYYHDRYGWDDWYWHRPSCFGIVSHSLLNSAPIGGGGTMSAGSNVPTGEQAQAMMNQVSSSSFSAQASSEQLCSNTYTLTTADSAPVPEVANDVGITVAGSLSDQQFHYVSNFPVEETKYVIVLKLLGETGKGKKIAKPVTVKTKQKCPTCGHMNKATSKFCTECGTGLEIA